MLLKANQIRVLKKIGTVFLATVLCILIVFNAGISDCFAFALTTTAVIVGISMLAAAGITFASYEAAETGVNAMYNNMDTATQSGFDTICNRYEEKVALDSAISKGLIKFSLEYWQSVLKAIIATFGTYAGITSHQIVSSSGLLSTGEAFNFTVNNVSVNNAIDVSLGNATLRYIGGSSSASLPSYVELSTFSSNRIARCLDIAGFTFALDIGSFQLNQTFNLSQQLTYTIPSGLERATYINFNGSDIVGSFQYFNGLPITKTVIDSMAGTFTWNYTSSGSNIVVGNMLGDIALSDGICPNGVWTNKSWSDWLNDLIFGSGAGVGVLPGNPSIDTTYTAGNDKWHDGSINDDVAIGSSPSIGISVPTTQDGAISLNPDQARDTTVSDVTIDATDVATGTGTGTGTGSLPNTKPGALPALSLPEILFKEKFPFCLPWDLYNLFSCLLADPIPPKFTIPFSIPRLGIDESIIIDLSQFEEQVEIVRFFLGASFVLALILISRKMIGAS